MKLVEVRKYLRANVRDLGSRLKTARESDGRSVQVLATLAGISTGYWYQIEKEERSWVSAEVLERIEEVLGVSFDVKFE